MKTRKVSVNFSISGFVTISAEIPANMTNEEFQRGLNASGDGYLVSITPGADVLSVKDNFQHIGKVTELEEVNCEYDLFTVKDVE
jgi:hypothetical protein